MRRLRIAVVCERSPTFLEGCKNRKQSFVRIKHQRVPLPNSSNPSLAQPMVDHLKAIVQRAINLGGRGPPAAWPSWARSSHCICDTTIGTSDKSTDALRLATRACDKACDGGHLIPFLR